jgi:hypothetical protein
LKKIIAQPPDPKPITRINYGVIKISIDEGEGVSHFPSEDRITPSSILVENIKSQNTGKIEEKQLDVPEEIMNYTEEQVKKYYEKYDSVYFSKDKIIIERNTSYLPDRFLVKLEGGYVKVFITDSEGVATIYDDFSPVPHKNIDGQLEIGIEVETIEEVWDKIQDYD